MMSDDVVFLVSESTISMKKITWKRSGERMGAVVGEQVFVLLYSLSETLVRVGSVNNFKISVCSKLDSWKT